MSIEHKNICHIRLLNYSSLQIIHTYTTNVHIIHTYTANVHIIHKHVNTHIVKSIAVGFVANIFVNNHFRLYMSWISMLLDSTPLNNRIRYQYHGVHRYFSLQHEETTLTGDVKNEWSKVAEIQNQHWSCWMTLYYICSLQPRSSLTVCARDLFIYQSATFPSTINPPKTHKAVK